MKLASRTGIFLLGASLLAAVGGGVSQAQARDEYGNPIDVRADYPRGDSGGDIRQTVARISDIDGSVSYARGDDPDEWQSADRNAPVTLGDRLYTSDRSRLELQVHGGNFVRLGSSTDLAVLNLTDDTKQFAIKSGVASFQIRRLDSDDVFEVDTPNAAITIQRPGDYRVDVEQDGSTRISVREGQVDVAAGGGSLSLGNGDALEIWGSDDSAQYQNVSIRPPDGWDRWVDERESRVARARSYEYVSEDISGIDDLDESGRWENIPSYGYAWTPTVVEAGWAPYRAGRWIWQDPWGWTWVSTEPWGWAPYHYGRWVFATSRWWWIPVPRRVAYVTYSPALVAFVGGGPGWSASVSVSPGGYVGWFPLAPRDPLLPWWGVRRPAVQVTNVTYVNRTYVTVVNQTTFVNGGAVVRNVVRDRQVIQQVEAAPVLRGPIPLLPTREAIRVSTRPSAAVVRPPAAVVSRTVVARVAPPPAPPTFDRKIAVIRENRGAPVAPAAAAELAARQNNRPQAAAAVKPVAPAAGRVTLQQRERPATNAPSNVPSNNPPANARAAPRVQPVAPLSGRPMATVDQPVAAAPVSAPRSRQRQAPAERESGNANRTPAAPPPASGNEPQDLRGRGTPVPSTERGRPTVPPRFQETPAMPARPSREENRRYVVTPPETPPAVETQRERDVKAAQQEQARRAREADRQRDAAAAQRQREAANEQEQARRAQQEAQRQQEMTERERNAQKEREAAAKQREAEKKRNTEQDRSQQPPDLRGRPTPAPAPDSQPETKRRPPEPTPRSASRTPERAATPRGRKPEPTKKPKDEDDSHGSNRSR